MLENLSFVAEKAGLHLRPAQAEVWATMDQHPSKGGTAWHQVRLSFQPHVCMQSCAKLA